MRVRGFEGSRVLGFRVLGYRVLGFECFRADTGESNGQELGKRDLGYLIGLAGFRVWGLRILGSSGLRV